MGDEWRGSQAASRCALHAADADLNSILAHNPLFCDRCRDEQVLVKTKGEELLFPNGPPRWMSTSSSSSSSSNNGSSTTTATTSTDQQTNVKKFSLPLLEFFNQFQSSFGGGGEAAAAAAVPQEEYHESREIRSIYDMQQYNQQPLPAQKTDEKPMKAAPARAEKPSIGGAGGGAGKKIRREKKQEAEKEKPHVPAGIAVHKLMKQGFSKDVALEKYVEIQRQKAGPKSEENKVQIDRKEMPWAPPHPKMLKKRQSVIQRVVDHQRYVAIVSNFLNANHSQPRFLQNRQEVRIMDEKLAAERMEYQKLALQSLSDRKKPIYGCDNHRVISYILYPIESDELALHLANRHGVRVVMCASSVMKILSNPWVGDSPNYVIPVMVKCHFSERTNRFENTCLVGKPCVEKAINGPSAWRRFVKFSIKLALYDNKPAKKTGGRQRANFAKSSAKTTDGGSEMKDGTEAPGTSAACDDEDDRGTLFIAEEEEEEKPAAPESASMNKKADGARNAKPDAATPSGTTT
ncbi:unnamed protein product [Gongylonema pulchrum]|uniref:NARG2_C domain-containing protein n=1 Tax=Gongylonema pulchrum TaxID=637853 RepID=A0A183DPX6_9BILA|nr:unnamed protein product [Gongylonema pulchrum]